MCLSRKFSSFDLILHDKSDNADDEGWSLGVGDIDDESSPGIVRLVFSEGVEHGPGDVETHGWHPEEDSHPGVLDQEAEAGAPARLQDLVPVLLQVQAEVDPGEEVAEEHVDQETNSDLAKHVSSELVHPEVGAEGEEHEEIRDEQSHWIQFWI